MKKRLLSISVLILLGLIPSCLLAEAFCEDWVLFSTFKSGNLIYYDRHSVEENSKNSVLIQTKVEYGKRGLEEDKKIMMEEGISEAEMIWRGYDRLCHTVILWEMQCQDNISCMLSFTDYDSSGKLLISHNVPANESCDSITPKAPEIYSIFEMLCSTKQRVGKKCLNN
jgi:hypothetical protein